MEEALIEFLIESTEGIANLDQDLIILEKNPKNYEALNRIFRTMHSIKGTCGMFGFSRLERLAHVGEDVLAAIREGNLNVNSKVIGVILKAVDLIKFILDGIELTKTESLGDDSLIITELRQLLQTSGSGPDSDLHLKPSHSPHQVTAPSQNRALTEQFLRVHMDTLDQLMNSIGELALTRNQLVQLANQDVGSRYLSTIQQLDRITSSLQKTAIKTRMQPVGNSWNKLPRIIRDLSHSAQKQIELKMMGQETEVDRQILKAIHDPLIHCVRNSADHGIEAPAVRKENKKTPSGTIWLNAFYEGDYIVIEIKDDGSGINTKAVRERAIQRELIRAEEADKLSDQEICRFIFEPGFSTVNQISEISGRGVGLDVVRTNIEKMGGNVDVQSISGYGTTVRIKVPFTLKIVSAARVKLTVPKKIKNSPKIESAA